MKRFLAFLLLFLLLIPSALAESPSERLAQLDIIDQRDERLQGTTYYYYMQPFHSAGCLPAATVNAATALLGTPETDIPSLLKDLMNALINQNYTPAIELGYLYNTFRSPRKSATALQKLVEPVTEVLYIEGAPSASSLFSTYSFDDNAHPLIIRKLSPHKSWHWFAELSAYLSAHGHPDARIVIFGAAAGDEVSSGPFRCGVHGHYVSLFFEAGEFHQDGTVYLLDSWPRAMEGDSYGEGQRFHTYYLFIEEPQSPFCLTYDATRITDVVMKLSLKPAMLEKLQSLNASDPARLDLQQQLTEAIQTFGVAYCAIYLP